MYHDFATSISFHNKPSICWFWHILWGSLFNYFFPLNIHILFQNSVNNRFNKTKQTLKYRPISLCGKCGRTVKNVRFIYFQIFSLINVLCAEEIDSDKLFSKIKVTINQAGKRALKLLHHNVYTTPCLKSKHEGFEIFPFLIVFHCSERTSDSSQLLVVLKMH